MSSRRTPPRTASLITLGCARNEVDSEELAARLEAAGWRLAEDGDAPDVIVVNTCGFIDSAKKDSIDTLLAAADSGAKVVAAGCMAERYGEQLAEALPEAAAVISFDDYADIGARLDDVVEGRPIKPHVPRDRRLLLPITPVERRRQAGHVPGHISTAAPPTGIGANVGTVREGEVPIPASGPRLMRKRLGDGPVASLKLASGCDRRCTFCAIPAFRGAYVSRPPEELLAEARWLAEQGVKELVLVSENSTSYGKDLGDLRSLEKLLPRLAEVDGIDRVRVSYLQPAELRPGLIDVIAGTDGVAPYFDISFQHASAPVLRRMRRFGDPERFLGLLETIRERAPHAGIRSNFIVGFPGETEERFAELVTFLQQARLDVIGVFGYSDEEGTEAAGFDDKLDQDAIDERVAALSELAEELTAQRAEERIGEELRVLIEEDLGDGGFEGRADHQGPEVDGSVTVQGIGLAPGRLVRAVAVDAEGVDLIARIKAGP
ncbi:30S ribosomal protein S12 methylthiotransferase RimO [Thermopolyspora sp. NPDC052614]|uniref:30S ribosomal protein S12 methylthiotransferase RimO n=1 Tax=Thermopolyspora sp. NPDC052614 TaxID=3155682 RepID=UPI003445AF56